jgi:hypothetical protein
MSKEKTGPPIPVRLRKTWKPGFLSFVDATTVAEELGRDRVHRQAKVYSGAKAEQPEGLYSW